MITSNQIFIVTEERYVKGKVYISKKTKPPQTQTKITDLLLDVKNEKKMVDGFNNYCWHCEAT